MRRLEALARCRGGSWSPPYLSQWSNFQNFFVWWKLVKISIDFYHKWLPIIHSLAARGRRSDEGQSCLISSEKIQKFQFFSHKHVIYLKRTHFSCRIQLHDEKIWFDGKKLKKFQFFNFFVKNEGDQVSSMANFSNFFITNLKNDFATSCQKVWT